MTLTEHLSIRPSTPSSSWRTGSGTVDITGVDQAATEGFAPQLHRWLTDPKASFWQLSDIDPAGAHRYLQQIVDDPHCDAWIGEVDGQPAFYAETYQPDSLLSKVFTADTGDLGMHILIGPAGDQPRAGFTDDAFAAVMRHCLDHLGAHRIVVEPDVANRAIAAKNARAGFSVLRIVDLPDKTAALSLCSKEAFEESPLATLVTPRRPACGQDPVADRPANPAEHLRPELMEIAERHLVAKALSEFSHERLISPERLDQATGNETTGAAYEISLAPTGSEPVNYRFTARVFALNHWQVDQSSIRRFVSGKQQPLSALDLLIELREQLGIPDHLLSTYLEEVAATLASAAYKLHREQPSAAELAQADLPEVEAAMTEGHPAFLANNGRIGFGVDEFSRYAPETGAPIRLVWLAARRGLTELTLGAGLDEQTHYAEQLHHSELTRFGDRLAELGLDPADYLWFPVHPWQWEHRIAITFAVDLARQDLVFLGEGSDNFCAQQSIRTLLNRTHPDRGYTKLALSIQNMGFLRGMSPAYMRGAPEVNDFVAELVSTDPEFAECGFKVLRERAAIGYIGDAYHRSPANSPHRKMLAALWRESPTPLAGDENGVAEANRLATMAALLHRDADGASYASALIARAGIDPADWVRRYLRCYLRPLVHALEAHSLAFMPHGENLILELSEGVPVGVFMKDIGEEAAILTEQDLGPQLQRIVHPTEPKERALVIFTDVFDGVFRYLAAILDTDGVLPEGRFWALVTDCLAEYFEGRTATHDWWVDGFDHSCLNRLQLRNTLEMVDITDQSSSLMYAGQLPNPLHG